MGKKMEDEIGRELRRNRPSPPDGYVDSLARSVRGPSRPRHVGRRAAFAIVLSVVLAAALAVTGSLAQTVAAPKSVAKIVKKAVTSEQPSTVTLQRVQNSPAINQYGGDEGCTPGYWKNHPESWVGYSTGQTVGSVFSSAPATVSGLTLLEGLDAGGGGEFALTRQAVAALLNAAHPSVDYPLSTGDIISMVNAAFASGDADAIESLKDTLDSNNNLHAPGFCD